MKKNLIKTMTAATLVGLMVSAAGCAVYAEEAAPAAAQGAEEAQELKSIGEKAEGETVYAVKLTNQTGKDITGLAIKEAAEEAFPENMLTEGDVFAQDEERILYYDSAAAVEANEAANEVEENQKLMKPVYTVQITFADESVEELHSFPFGDVEAAALCQGEEVLYITYTSVAEGTEINTEEAELMEKQMAEEMNFEPEQVTYDQSQIVYEVPVYQEPAPQQPAAQEPAAAPVQEPAAAPAQEPAAAPVQEPAAAPVPDMAPVTMDPAGGEGCVTDGAVY